MGEITTKITEESKMTVGYSEAENKTSFMTGVNKTFDNPEAFNTHIKAWYMVCRLKKKEIIRINYNHNYTDRFCIYSIQTKKQKKCN